VVSRAPAARLSAPVPPRGRGGIGCTPRQKTPITEVTEFESESEKCVCGHVKHEHDRAYPGGQYLGCCRFDRGCTCEKFRRLTATADRPRPSFPPLPSSDDVGGSSPSKS
jgi:hypothetical protein